MFDNIKIDDILNKRLYEVVSQRYQRLTDDFLSEQIKNALVDESSDYFTLEIPS